MITSFCYFKINLLNKITELQIAESSENPSDKWYPLIFKFNFKLNIIHSFVHISW